MGGWNHEPDNEYCTCNDCAPQCYSGTTSPRQRGPNGNRDEKSFASRIFDLSGNDDLKTTVVKVALPTAIKAVDELARAYPYSSAGAVCVAGVVWGACSGLQYVYTNQQDLIKSSMSHGMMRVSIDLGDFALKEAVETWVAKQQPLFRREKRVFARANAAHLSKGEKANNTDQEPKIYFQGTSDWKIFRHKLRKAPEEKRSDEGRDTGSNGENEKGKEKDKQKEPKQWVNGSSAALASVTKLPVLNRIPALLTGEGAQKRRTTEAPKGTLFVFTRNETEWSTSGAERGVVSLWCWGHSTKPIEDLINEIYNVEELKDMVQINTPQTALAKWSTQIHVPPRSMDSIYLGAEVKKDLIDDIAEYLDPSTRVWYQDRGIPYRRGYLFHGPPGCGKSSCAKAIAATFGMDIYMLSLNNKEITDVVLMNLFQQLADRCLVLLEDIDCAGMDRKLKQAVLEKEQAERMARLREAASDTTDSDTDEESGSDVKHKKGKESRARQDNDKKCAEKDEKKVKKKEKKKVEETKPQPVPEPPSNVSLSALLNVLDGAPAQEGRLVIMTTNVLENLDEALIRPGRVDVDVHFTLATQEQAEALFNNMYQPKKAGRTTKYDLEKIPTLAKEFARQIPEQKLSCASLQGYVVKYKTRPQAAMDGVAAWVKQELIKQALKALKDAGGSPAEVLQDQRGLSEDDQDPSSAPKASVESWLTTVEFPPIPRPLGENGPTAVEPSGDWSALPTPASSQVKDDEVLPPAASQPQVHEQAHDTGDKQRTPSSATASHSSKSDQPFDTSVCKISATSSLRTISTTSTRSWRLRLRSQKAWWAGVRHRLKLKLDETSQVKKLRRRRLLVD